jgi:hypothetical protein
MACTKVIIIVTIIVRSGRLRVTSVKTQSATKDTRGFAMAVTGIDTESRATDSTTSTVRERHTGAISGGSSSSGYNTGASSADSSSDSTGASNGAISSGDRGGTSSGASSGASSMSA